MTWRAQREAMVALLARRGIDDARVLRALAAVPRHRFVPPPLVPRAYDDGALPLGHGQTISQPYIVALMTQALCLGDSARVLEIGTGSGYQAAVLAETSAQVYSVERVAELVASARSRLDQLGYGDRVQIRCGDGNDGWSEMAPFDAVIVTAAVREVPRLPYEQLACDGRMVVPIGDDARQELVCIRRDREGPSEHCLGPCVFVKLIGRHGWEG